MRIAAFGFRSLPPSDGSAGADKFAIELYTRMRNRGHEVTVYNRFYKSTSKKPKEFNGLKIVWLKTINASGFDTLLHSLKASFHIIVKNTADVVHIHNGGNSIWAIPLRIVGKRVFVSQDGVDWKRDKWPFYAKIFLRLSSFITAYIPNQVIFDNIYARELFETKFKKKFEFLPYGSESPTVKNESDILAKLNLKKNEYFLFVGRFIPDKGLQYLIPAFEKIETSKKLVLVGGSPNPSEFEKELYSTKDDRIVFPGYIYGEDTLILMKNCYQYIQPSDIEGLSPVILTVMGLEVPLLCSDIKENLYITGETATTFSKSDVDSLHSQINYSIENPIEIMALAKEAKIRAEKLFSWEKVTDDHLKIFNEILEKQ
ncbi:MAG: glycosyltransferase family 4 protein [Ignavibacteriae bacterium]|nr:glycosyltransferase [Ignavibacteriota bacterium]NOG99100.1 glycosyltransferase family 4 protein [Ignavibacteriota bacterium]